MIPVFQLYEEEHRNGQRQGLRRNHGQPDAVGARENQGQQEDGRHLEEQRSQKGVIKSPFFGNIYGML